jgi:CMP-2-keto-3-deoxyoctulosonic acid synthetase
MTKANIELPYGVQGFLSNETPYFAAKQVKLRASSTSTPPKVVEFLKDEQRIILFSRSYLP